MNYSQFLNMIPEATLMAVLVIVFIADFCSHGKAERKWFNPFVCVLLLAQLLVNICPESETVSVFGGIYEATPAANMMKSVLTFGTLVVVLQSRNWLTVTETRHEEGEFYMLTISTLLGMFMMMSAGSFLMFFLGLEMASVPMGCMVALDKFRKNSAEAAAKFILTATFSSGVMLYGISFLYGSTGTLYFADFARSLSYSPMSVMGMIFFIAGLGFKISLVPFHYWTADTYQGAPTTVTGYLSVISKGAAAFTLVTILYKVFFALTPYWMLAMCILVVLSITVANLMAIRQTELKRFMAFSSISQAGYIMLVAIGGNYVMSITALMYYVLIYIVANMAVFTIIASIENTTGKTDMATYNGLYRTNPKMAFLMTLALFSLGGIPPFAGMFSKFFVFLAAVDGRPTVLPYFIVFIALINTVVSLYYYLLIVKAMYINKDGEPVATYNMDMNTKITLVVCTAGVLFFGIGSCVYNALHSAAAL
ncbi:MAG: NADH-quinone oxidoreductase subunit N [Prevotellaceae bacterium]|nr:NADH-quinone oxidoreductase subunit N [Prevotellaceae bacterium]MDO4932720.1 NADH-quinone oxidoreductase subunit N [Prevotellaceae bacterium]